MFLALYKQPPLRIQKIIFLYQMLYKTDDVMNVQIDEDFSLRKTLADILMKMNILGSTHKESSAGFSTGDTDWTF